MPPLSLSSLEPQSNGHLRSVAGSYGLDSPKRQAGGSFSSAAQERLLAWSQMLLG